MRIFLSLALFSLLAVYLVVDAQEDEGEVGEIEEDLAFELESRKGKPGKCSGKPMPKKPAKFFSKWTGKKKNCQCWWDTTKNNCACCKNKGKQCGFPMGKFCWQQTTKGCPGVCNNDATMSNKGFPCYSDPTNKNCAWCSPFAKQCAQNSITGPGSKKGSRCTSAKKAGYCDGIQGDCGHMSGDVCSPNASCMPWKKKGKKQHKQCRCKNGFKGNGIYCADSDGNISAPPDTKVEVVIERMGDFYTYPHTEGEYTSGPEMDSLLGEMEKAEKVCSNAAICQASFTDTVIPG